MKMFYSPSSFSKRGMLTLLFLLCRTILCDGYCPPETKDEVLMTRIEKSSVAVHGVVVQVYPDMKSIDMALVSVYKGGIPLASVSRYRGSMYNTTDRQISFRVESTFEDCFDWWNSRQKELIVFLKVRDPMLTLETTPSADIYLDIVANAIEYSAAFDYGLWYSLGWSDWGQWGPCSKTCSRGYQVQKRFCRKTSCEGFDVRERTCNTFRCEGAVNPLSPGSRKNFHPAQAHWNPIPERPHAYSLKPSSYIWIASKELFDNDESFPKAFTAFVSLKMDDQVLSKGYGQGNVFSLRSRRQKDSYLSLELLGYNSARLVHNREGYTKTINFTVTLSDLNWHHIAISVQNDNNVQIYVDCRLERTEVLAKDALLTEKDADLIIGYLFTGGLEQLTIVPKGGIAHKQCSNQYSEFEDEQYVPLIV